MPIKVKRVGKWKVGDVVFKDDPRFGENARPTPAGWEIIKFSEDKTTVTVKHLIWDQRIVTCPVEQLRESGGSPYPYGA